MTKTITSSYPASRNPISGKDRALRGERDLCAGGPSSDLTGAKGQRTSVPGQVRTEIDRFLCGGSPDFRVLPVYPGPDIPKICHWRISCKTCFCILLLSHPPRGGWIEISAPPGSGMPSWSHPPRGGWIEICLTTTSWAATASPTPRRVGGLKSGD